MAKKMYNTPKRTFVVKTRLTKEEKENFEEKCRILDLTQAECIRQAILTAKLKTVIHVSPVNEEMLEIFGNLCAELGKIGSNLNQIAHHLNAGGYLDSRVHTDVAKMVGSLANLKYQILKEVGEMVGNDKAYRF